MVFYGKNGNGDPRTALGIRPTVSLSTREIKIIENISAFQMDFVFWKLVEDKKISPRVIPLAEKEFKRFVALVAIWKKPMAMISPVIDEVWHQFILFTGPYSLFCRKTVGHFIDHLPDTPSTPVPAIAGQNFLDGYKSFFGEIERIWFIGMSEETRAFYKQGNISGMPATAKWSGWTGEKKAAGLRRTRRKSR